MQVLSLEYLAGFFDGEGSISVSNGKNRRGNTWPVLQIALGQINPTILLQVKRRYGGSLHATKSTKRHRRCWKYQNAAAQAERFLRDLQPHLHLKASEARAALQYRKTITSKGNRNRLSVEERRERIAALRAFHKVRLAARTAEY